MNLAGVRNYSYVIHGTIPYNGFEELLLKSPLLLRLQRVSQSSLAFITFPSNKVKRFEHSIGTMHLAGNMLKYSIANSETEVVSELLNKINEKLIDDYKVTSKRNKRFFGQTYPNKFYGVSDKQGFIFKNLNKVRFTNNGFFNQMMPANVPSDLQGVYIVLLQGIRIAGLVHDIGHLPYSHTLEFTFKEIFNLLCAKHQKNPLEERFFTLFQEYNTNSESGDSRQIHEAISEALFRVLAVKTSNDITKQWTSQKQNSDPLLQQTDEYCVLSYWAFIVASMVLYEPNTYVYSMFHHMVSGVIDADRMDYVSRDLFASAVSSDIIKYNRLFLSFAFRRDNENQILFSILAKSINDVEEFLRKRWRIYREINLHHGVHKSEVVMRNLLRKKAQDSFDLYGYVDVENEENNLPDDFILGINKVLDNLHSNGDSSALENLILELDDSWLDTLLKHGNGDEDALVEELIKGRDAYRSEIKRFSDFIDFDEIVFSRCLKKFRDFGDEKTVEILDGLDKYYYDYIEGNVSESSGSLFNSYVQIAQFLNGMTNSVHLDEDLNLIHNALNYIKYYNTLFTNDLYTVSKALRKLLKQSNIAMEDFWIDFQKEFNKLVTEFGFKKDDVLIDRIRLSNGIPQDESEDIYIWKTRKKEHVRFRDYSILEFELKLEKNLTPIFHMYTSKDFTMDMDDFFEKLAIILCELLFEPLFKLVRVEE